MVKLKIHESLLPYIEELTGKEKLDVFDFNDRAIIEKVNAAYEDTYTYLPKINVFLFITYRIISKFYDLKPISDKKCHEYVEMVLNDYNVRRKLYEINPKSEFFSVMKDIIPYYMKFMESLKSNNGYMVISSYEEIVSFLETETLKDKTYEELEAECKKRYNYPNNNVTTYDFRMRNKNYSKKPYEVGMYRSKGFYSETCELLSHYFYDKMLEYYKKTGYYYSPINNDLSFYSIAGKGIIGYKYDDNIAMSIDNYRWDRFEFWAILNMENKPKVKIDISKIKRLVKNSDNYIIAPNDLVEEALIHNLLKTRKKVKPDFIQKLKDMGVPEEYYRLNALTTYDNRVFFFYPDDFKKLRIKDLSKLPTLNLILSKNEENREKYLNKLTATYKGKYKIIGKSKEKALK